MADHGDRAGAPPGPLRAGPPADLQAAIDGLYTTFAPYRRPRSLRGCACCWSGEPVGDGAEVVVAPPGGDRPLRDVAAGELAALAGAEVPPTAGALEAMRHYLPRILEIAAGPGFGWPDREIVLGRLADRPALDGQVWTMWPVPERDAVRRFLHALWLDRLATPAEHAVDEVLCGIGLADPDIEWYLTAWLRFDEPAAALHLHRFLVDNAAALARGRLLAAHWATAAPPAPENRRRVVEWLRSPATGVAVAAAADRARTPAEREALEEAYLRWLG